MATTQFITYPGCPQPPPGIDPVYTEYYDIPEEGSRSFQVAEWYYHLRVDKQRIWCEIRRTEPYMTYFRKEAPKLLEKFKYSCHIALNKRLGSKSKFNFSLWDRVIIVKNRVMEQIALKDITGRIRKIVVGCFCSIVLVFVYNFFKPARYT